MGTSSSAKGPGNRSPLVPPWADSEPGKPLPPAEGQRFRGFRTELGRVASGAGGSMAKALGKYARDASGGSDYGPRRFGPSYIAGADLVGLIGALGEGGSGEAIAGKDLSQLAGQPLDVAAQEIANALAPENADGDQVRAAIQESISEVLGDQETFDPTTIGRDQIAALLVEFFARILFQEISVAAGEAWKRAPNVQRCTATENELFELVRAAMDKHLSPRLVGDLPSLTRAQIQTLEQAALRDIWRAWESDE